MRPKKTRKRRFTPLKSAKKNGVYSMIDPHAASHLPFSVGDEVLACWQDGLYYIAVVKSVSYVCILHFCVKWTVFDLIFSVNI